MVHIMPMVIFAIIVAAVISAIYKIGYKMDKDSWNNGVCTKCEKGFWKAFDCDSGGSVGYKCTNCGYTHWQNGYLKLHCEEDR